MGSKILIDPTKARLLHQFRQELGVRSDAEVIDYALTTLQWVLKHRRQGRMIAAIDEDNHRHIELRVAAPAS